MKTFFTILFMVTLFRACPKKTDHQAAAKTGKASASSMPVKTKLP